MLEILCILSICLRLLICNKLLFLSCSGIKKRLTQKINETIYTNEWNRIECLNYIYMYTCLHLFHTVIRIMKFLMSIFFLILKMLFRLNNASLPTPGAMKLQIRQRKFNTIYWGTWYLLAQKKIQAVINGK